MDLNSLPYEPEELWWKRWLSLRENINNTIDQLASVDTVKCKYSEPELNRIQQVNKTIGTLLTYLGQFGDQQFAYFYCGFGGIAQGVCKTVGDDSKVRERYLLIDPAQHPEFVLRSTLDQLAKDYDTIKKALFWRLHGTSDEMTALDEADALAKRLLERFEFYSNGENQSEEAAGFNDPERPPGVTQPPCIITYFDVNPSIHILPYANAALLGIPFSSTMLEYFGESHEAIRWPREIFVMGHEIGHYVYRNGKKDDQPLRERLPLSVYFDLPFIGNWVEELFSDVFAVLSVNDPGIIDMSLQMVLDNSQDMRVDDSGTHPIDIIRPYIYAVALAEITRRHAEEIMPETEDSDLTQAAEKLESSTARIFELGPEYFTTLDRYGNTVRLSVEHDLAPRIKKFVLEIIDLMWRNFAEDVDISADEVINASKSLQYHEPRRITYSVIERGAPDDQQQQEIACEIQQRDIMAPLRGLGFRRIEPAIWKVVFEAYGWIGGGLPGDTHATGGLEGTRSD